MLYYFSFLLVCYVSLIALFYYVDKSFIPDIVEAMDSTDIYHFIMVNFIMFFASPIFLLWALYEEFIKKED